MKVFITRRIPDSGLKLLRETGYEIVINPEDRVLSKSELLESLEGKGYDAILCLLTDKIDGDVFDAAGPQCKIFANYAVGVDNIDIKGAKERNIMVTNTPGVLTNSVAEHTFTLLLTVARRVAESDRFTRAGKYAGWAPMLLLGTDVSEKTLGIIGLGRIGSRVAHHGVNGFDMKVIYNDVKRSEDFEKEFNAQFRDDIDDVFKEADFVSLHVPLLPATRHLVNERRLRLMKKTSYLINTSRGPVIDEAALVVALKESVIRGAALDVYEEEVEGERGHLDPEDEERLRALDNVILTPHIASATVEAREEMTQMAVESIVAAVAGKKPKYLVKGGE